MTAIEPEWHYVIGHAQQGPIALEALHALYAAGTIRADTRVWRPGLEVWTRYGDLFGVADTPAAPPPPPEVAPPAIAAAAPAADPAYWPYAAPAAAAVEAPPGADGWNPAPPHPWRRYFARSIDTLLLTLVWTVGVGIVQALTQVVLIPQNSGRLADMLVSIVLLLLDGLALAALLSYRGTTPGKAIFGIRVRTAAGEKPTLAIAVQRELLVFLKGMGVAIPLVALAAQIVSYNRLKQNGVTSWDQDLGLVVQYRDMSDGRLALAAVATAAACAAVIALTVYGAML